MSVLDMGEIVFIGIVVIIGIFGIIRVLRKEHNG